MSKGNHMDNKPDLGQMVVEQMDTIREGVSAYAKRVQGVFSITDIDDLVSDTVETILAGQKKFDPERGNPRTFCRMVAWQKARDAARSIARGGQTSGYIGGYKTDAINMTDASDDEGNTLAIFGRTFEADTESPLDTLIDAESRRELDDALTELSDEERELYELSATGELDVDAYAAAHGVKPGTIHVRKNRLIAKIRGLLKK